MICFETRIKCKKVDKWHGVVWHGVFDGVVWHGMVWYCGVWSMVRYAVLWCSILL